MPKFEENDIPEVEHHPDTYKSEKYKKLKKAILSPFISHITIEGSIRGGKDVSALDAYSELLMLTPDKLHLVTGTSESQAMETVYEADGFGLKYLLPHGKMVRVKNKDKFIFKDYYGQTKEVHFFGNVKYNDYKKFKGVSYGTHYANEATLQNTGGLKFAEGRTVRSRWRKIIHTQNPVAPADPYYIDYESKFPADEDKATRILNRAEKMRETYNKIKLKYDKKIEDEKRKLVRVFLKEHGVNIIQKLSDKERANLRKKTLQRKFDIVMERENELQIHNNINSAYYEFEPYYENPNDIRNGLYFRYFHYTMKDNPTIEEARLQQLHDEQNKSTIYYKRDYLGKRSVAEDAIYDNLTEENFYRYSLPENLTDAFEKRAIPKFSDNFSRYLAIDYGVRDNFVILDILIDPQTFTVMVEDEVRYIRDNDPSQRPGSDSVYFEYLQKQLNKRENGHYSAVIVDPAARSFINFLTSKGVYAIAAKNTVKGKKSKRAKDSIESDKSVDKSIAGISLVKNGFDFKRILINNENCKTLRQELESYRLDPDKKKIGKEVPLKKNDHGADALRYFINTVVRDINRWTQNKEEYDIYEKIQHIEEPK